MPMWVKGREEEKRFVVPVHEWILFCPKDMVYMLMGDDESVDAVLQVPSTFLYAKLTGLNTL